MEFRRKQLANGLTIVAECNDQAHTSAVGFFVKTGARDEDRPLMGVSHFLEHMMFKGTARRSADDVNREFDEIGANYNAFTSHELTVYYAAVLPEFLPRAIDLIGDMLRPALRDDDFNMEKNVILEEISMYEDRPQSRLHDMLIERFFGEHPLSFRVLGTNETVGDLTAEQMRSYFSQRYSPDNITVAAAGKIDFDQLVIDVAERAGSWQATGATRAIAAPTAAQHEHTITDDRLSRHYVAMMCPGPSVQDERRYAAKVLCDVLGDADNSRMYWALVDPGLADEADVAPDFHDQTGAFYAYASCAPQRAGEVEKILLQTLDQYAGDIQPEEIQRAKNKLATLATVSGERPAGRMQAVGAQWTYLGQYRPLEEELQRLMAVTEDDIRNLLAEFPFQPRTIVRMGPG